MSRTSSEADFDIELQPTVRPNNEGHEDDDDGSMPPVNTNPQPPKRNKLPDPVLPRTKRHEFPLKGSVLEGKPPVRSEAMPLSSARRTLGKIEPLPHNLRGEILYRPSIRKLAADALEAAKKYHAKAVELDGFSVVGSLNRLRRIEGELRSGKLKLDEALKAELAFSWAMSAGGPEARLVTRVSRIELRKAFDEIVLPAKRSLREAIQREATPLIEKVREMELAYGAGLGISPEHRTSRRLEALLSELIVQLQHDERRSTSFTILCEEILGHCAPILVPPTGGAPKDGRGRPYEAGRNKARILPPRNREWFSIENVGNVPLHVSVNPEQPVSKWLIVSPGHCVEGTALVNAQFDDGLLQGDAMRHGELLAGRRRLLTCSAVFALNESEKSCEVICYEGGLEPQEPAKN